MDKYNDFIPQDDIEFERELAEKERLERENAELREKERSEIEEKERRSYERDLQDKKIELMKLKQGVIEHSDTIKEEVSEKRKLTFFEWLDNVWYRSKWIIIFAVFAIAAVGYITYDTVTKVKPDLTVLVVMNNNALHVRAEEVESFFETYAEDLNGDGKVKVLAYNISTDYSDPTTATASQAQIMSQLQSGENMIIISDGTTDFAVHDFTQDPVNFLSGDCMTPNGISLNCALTRDKLKWQAMPDGLYIGLREPTRLLSASEEAMQKSFDEALPTYLRIYEAINASEE